jgi:hypothetical protein
MALPLLFLAGTSIVRAATPTIARYLAKQGLKRATGAAAKKPVSSTVTSIKQAQKLKPSTKVAGKRPSGSMTQQTTPKSKPLRADPKDRISTPAKKAKTTSTGTPTQRKILGAGMAAASLSTLIPKKESGKSQASTQKKTATRTGMGDRKSARPAAKEKNFNVGVSRGGVSFDEAFAHFRKKGNKTFTWNDKKYTTELASKKDRAKKANALVNKAAKESLAKKEKA